MSFYTVLYTCQNDRAVTMFQLAIILHLIKSLGIKVPKCKAPSAKHVAQFMKGFEWCVMVVVGIFAVLWIMAIIVVKHLLKVIWDFK